MQAKNPKYVIVVDQGSRAAPPIVDSPIVKSLIIDHHLSDDFPKNAIVISACYYPPVATSSLLTYEICKTLHPDLSSTCGFLCAMGTHGDLGNTLKWKPPFPDMTEVFKTHTKKAINDAVALVNAPRRTSKFDVISAWQALLEAKSPKEVLGNKRLLSARAEINEEVERQTHTPPKFSKDGKIAVLRIKSEAQVHGVIATRWASDLDLLFYATSDLIIAGRLPQLQSPRNHHSSQLRISPWFCELFMPYCPFCPLSWSPGQYHRFVESSCSFGSRRLTGAHGWELRTRSQTSFRRDHSGSWIRGTDDFDANWGKARSKAWGCWESEESNPAEEQFDEVFWKTTIMKETLVRYPDFDCARRKAIIKLRL